MKQIAVILFFVSLVAFTYTFTNWVLDSKRETNLEEETWTWVGIAGYRNTETYHKREGKFIGIMLGSEKIKWNSFGSVGVTVNVSSKDADRARYLLAKGLTDQSPLLEKGLIDQPLKITLLALPDSENRTHAISPEKVIKEYEVL